MVLVREGQELARHAPALQDVERRQTFGDGQTVVEIAMDGLFHHEEVAIRSVLTGLREMIDTTTGEG